MAACRGLLRDGSRTFLAASRLLPTRVRDPATALYAFCRLADDAVDLGHGSTADLRERLDRIFAGRPAAIPADRALRAVVARFAVPRALLDALIEGFEWDARGRRYETLADLNAYAARVAGTVGAMMALLMDQREPAVVASACDLGIAMQFTNIARDVGEDARNGRLYLPLHWFAEVGLDPADWLADPQPHPSIRNLVQRLLCEADNLYRHGEAGIAALPADCRAGIYAARLLYAEIGSDVAQAGYDSVSRRARVAWPRKATLLAQALTASRLPHRSLPDVALGGATSAFVEAVRHTSAHRGIGTPINVSSGLQNPNRLVWLFDLFASLERADRRKHLRRLDPAG